jgi:NitT/TauT family transport system ATP-binding protein
MNTSIIEPIVQLNRVFKRFESGTLAISDVSLTADPGEFISIVGPSGCGKSTILRLVAGLETASSGNIQAPAITFPQSQGSTAFVFQEPTLMPWASVFDNIWLPLRLQGMGRREASSRISAVLKTVGLEDFSHAYSSQLSGGMKMRVSIARALITRPNVLLMDEPFAALDDFTRQQLNNDLLHWQTERSIAILFVTHNIAEAVFLSHRVLVMSPRPGKIARELFIKAPYPRTTAFRNSNEFMHYCRELTEALTPDMMTTRGVS